MTPPRKLNAKGEQARARAREVAQQAAQRGRRKRYTGKVPDAVADRVAQQRAAAPPQPLPPVDGESEAQR